MSKFSTSASIFPQDTAYPSRLDRVFGRLALPTLRYIGNLDLLSKPSVGFCGSRKATELALSVTEDCVSQLAEEGIVITAGYAAGVDITAHSAALGKNGQTIIVLPEGLNHFRIKRELKDKFDPQNILIISQFNDNDTWRADRAMDRNKVIVGLSDVVIVVEARDKGGTLNAGLTSLKSNIPLFAASFSSNEDNNEGNRILQSAGARALRRNRVSGRAELRSVFDLLHG